jgi:hypothetical protein
MTTAFCHGIEYALAAMCLVIAVGYIRGKG